MKAFFSSLFLLSCASLLAQEAATGKRISAVEAVRVSTPVGTAPRLPYQLWVKYADGHKAYRQVRWSNSALVTEQEQAAQPVGTSYQVEGYIVGDDSTPQ